jgi:hypothetical protein
MALPFGFTPNIDLPTNPLEILAMQIANAAPAESSQAAPPSASASDPSWAATPPTPSNTPTPPPVSPGGGGSGGGSGSWIDLPPFSDPDPPGGGGSGGGSGSWIDLPPFSDPDPPPPPVPMPGGREDLRNVWSMKPAWASALEAGEDPEHFNYFLRQRIRQGNLPRDYDPRLRDPELPPAGSGEAPANSPGGDLSGKGGH